MAQNLNFIKKVIVRMNRVILSEIKRMFTDEGLLLVFVLSLVFYSGFYLLPFSNDILRNVPIAVVDLDHTVLSRKLIRAFDTNEMLKVTYSTDNFDQANQLYQNDDVKAFIIIPKDFEKDLKRGVKVVLPVYEDNSYMIVYKQVATGVSNVIGNFGTGIELRALMKKGLSKEEAQAIRIPVNNVETALFNPSGSYETYLYPVILIMILQQTLLIGITMMGGTAREYKLQLFTYFNVRSMFMTIYRSVAHVFVYTIYGMIFLYVMPQVAVYTVHINFTLNLLVLVTFLFSVSFLGQTLVILFSEREFPFIFFIASSIPMIFLTGFVWPIESMPEIMKLISKMLPVTVASDALVKLNQMGAKPIAVFDNLMLLFGQCFIYFVSAIYVNRYLYKEEKQHLNRQNLI